MAGNKEDMDVVDPTVPVLITVLIVLIVFLFPYFSSIAKWFTNNRFCKPKLKRAKAMQENDMSSGDSKVSREALSDMYESEKEQTRGDPGDQHIKTADTVSSLDDVTQALNLDSDAIKELAVTRTELSPSGLLEQASGGLVLKGMLVTNKVEDCIEVRKTVIQAPSVVLKSPMSPQKEGVIDFTSEMHSDIFHQSLNTMGHTIANRLKSGQSILHVQAALPVYHIEQQKAQSNTETNIKYYAREMYSYVPRAVCDLDPRKLRLCENVLEDLKELEQVIVTTKDEMAIKKKTESFLKTYGSHINVGSVEFGGIYQMQAAFSSETSTCFEKVHCAVQGTLGDFASSMCEVNLGGSVSRHHNGDESNRSHVTMYVSKTGGPQEVTSLPLWKKGLIECKDTWAVIDRGSKTEDFMGIWELIHQHQSEFLDAKELATILQSTWQSVSGMTPELSRMSDLATEKNQSGVLEHGSEAQKLLEELGLKEYYPSKISLEDVMCIRCDTGDSYLSDLPWRILRKLIMLDFNGRDSEFQKSASKDAMDDKYTLEDLIDDSCDGENEMSLNALDIFQALYACCDLVLKQTLVQKMFLCRLAVPLISPQMSSGSLIFSLWALRSITVEWKNRDQVCFDSSVVSQPMHTVSFLKVGNVSISKSILLNRVVSEHHHHTFWNRECPNANSYYSLARGLVEAQWYLPTGNTTDTFKNVTMFLNLRGDACEEKLQVEVLTKISNVVVCYVEATKLEDANVLNTLTEIHNSSSGVVLVLAANDPKVVDSQLLRRQIGHYQKSKADTSRVIVGFKRGIMKTNEVLQCELRNTIHDLLSTQDKRSIVEASTLAQEVGIQIDEDDVLSQAARVRADQILSSMEGKSTNECKAEMLPLQGKYWQEWSKLQKDIYRSLGKDSDTDVIHEIAHIQERMEKLRKNQRKCCDPVNPLMKAFLENLSETIDSSAATLFLQYLKLSLDELSRDTLPGLQRQYQQKWIEVSRSKTKTPSVENGKLKDELAVTERTLAEASLGVEHLMREVAQMYEAGHKRKSELSQSTRETIEQLPNIGAQLLLKGHSIEIMDGDTANVPLTWVKAVFSALTELVGDKKVFVISVLGIQSSGKSTLLNTMFGLQFAVSAGRCTRGVYMQLIKVDKESSDLPYDYVMVVDTEGLCAPELGQLKHNNDNQLATFVIGLGDVTVLNIKGENVTEISNVLQIAVHAFLRMKLTHQTKRTSIFVHQNVPAINAREKMKYGCQKLQDTLDDMTVEACAAEHIVDISTFNEVIEFDSESDVWYISDLWLGDPPMAPVNPGYTKKVQEVKNCLLYDLSQKQETFLTFSDMILRVEDLWKGILSENFVFSFRNSLAAKAYDSLESMYHEKSWMVQNGISEWVTQTAYTLLQKCQTLDELEICCAKLLLDLESIVMTLNEQVHTDLSEFFRSHNQRELIIQWKSQKVEGLNNEVQLFRSRAEKDIHQKNDSLRIDLLKEAKQGQHHIEIMNKAKELAHEMKGQVADETELLAKFDQVWIQWVKEFAARTTTAVMPTSIEQKVEKIIFNRLTKYNSVMTEELQKNPLSRNMPHQRLERIQSGDINETHLSINYKWPTRVYKDFKNYVSNKPRLKSECANKAARVINNILGEIEVDLEDIEMQDVGFQDSYATSVIKKVMDGVESHNQMFKGRFTFKPDLIAKIIVHVCCYAVGVFKKMQKGYDDNHSITRKIETYKETTWTLFKNIVKQSSIEVTAADVLSKHMEVIVQDAVKQRLTSRIVNEILENLSFRKYHLLVKILEDLADGGFEGYRSFLSNSKAFGQQWITKYTKKRIFSGTRTNSSEYVKYTSSIISMLTKCISRSILHATETVQENKRPNIKIWGKAFCAALVELPVKEDDLRHVLEQNVQDFDHFSKLLLKWLPPLEEKMVTGFKGRTHKTIRWEGATPYKLILDRLWGCEAQCPFCGEVCQRTESNHLSPNDCHQCIQHRPSGVNGVREVLTELLCVESCNFDIQSNGGFMYADLPECKESASCVKGEHYPLREYKKFLPDWDIAPSPNMESSKYWMWVMAKYKNQLAEWYDVKVPYIPSAWHQITKQEALDSLRVHYG